MGFFSNFFNRSSNQTERPQQSGPSRFEGANSYEEYMRLTRDQQEGGLLVRERRVRQRERDSEIMRRETHDRVVRGSWVDYGTLAHSDRDCPTGYSSVDGECMPTEPEESSTTEDSSSDRYISFDVSMGTSRYRYGTGRFNPWGTRSKKDGLEIYCEEESCTHCYKSDI